MKIKITTKRMIRVLLSVVMLTAILAGNASAQYEIRWMAAGSFNNFYSALGGEFELEYSQDQCTGWSWPSIYNYQDMMAWTGLWIGVQNFGPGYPNKVVHAGPRFNGVNEFFPVSIKTYNRYTPPQVVVNGSLSFNQPVVNDGILDTLKADQMIEIVTNTAIGLTMTKKAMQFSHEQHENYQVIDYTFTNTGYTDRTNVQKLNQTLDSVYVFFNYRLCINKQVAYVIGDGPVDWGANTMIDTRGDGPENIAKYNDPPNERFRAQYCWHGLYPPFTDYDNIGAPIWHSGADRIDESDSTGRLGAPQFPGVVTLHADKATNDLSDDPEQPRTTMWEYSDHPLFFQNDANNPVEGAKQYMMMSKGHMDRHADVVQPDGNFLQPTGDPQLGQLSGWSFMNGYGPYTINPGESVHIVVAEASAGIDRQTCIDVGRQYKAGLITALEKNKVVFQGRDSIFQTFRRAIDNYNSGYTLGLAPLPPKVFNVNSGIGQVELSWDIYAGESVTGFKLYRAAGRVDGDYELIAELGSTDRSYNDQTPVRGINYYYYLVTVDPHGYISNRYLSQTYDPVNLKRPSGASVNDARVVPNPYNIASNGNRLRFIGEPDKIAFLNIPGNCTIEIYTEYGELIKMIDHNDGSGDAYWNCTTSSNQLVVSGIYIALIHDRASGQQRILKFIVIR